MKDAWEKPVKYWPILLGVTSMVIGLLKLASTCPEFYKQDGFWLVFFGGILWMLALWIFSWKLSKKDEEYDKKVRQREKEINKKAQEERKNVLKTKEIKAKSEKIYEILNEGKKFKCFGVTVLLYPPSDRDSFLYNQDIMPLVCCPNKDCEQVTFIDDNEGLFCESCERNYEKVFLKDILASCHQHFKGLIKKELDRKQKNRDGEPPKSRRALWQVQ